MDPDAPPATAATPGPAAAGPDAPRSDPDRRTVLMDFDGVIVREDSLGLFLRHHLVRAPWRVPGFVAATSAIAPLVGLPASRARALRLIVRAGLAGWSLDAYRTRAREFGARLGAREAALLAPGVAAARAHLADGDRVVVVTGSEEALARATLDAAGLGAVELVASRVVGGPFGVGIATHVYGPGKVRALAGHGILPPWDLAYSDSAADLPMLRGARSSVLVDVGPRAGAVVRAELGGRVRDVSWRRQP